MMVPRTFLGKNSRGTIPVRPATNQVLCSPSGPLSTVDVFAILSRCTGMHQGSERQTDDDKKGANGSKCS